MKTKKILALMLITGLIFGVFRRPIIAMAKTSSMKAFTSQASLVTMEIVEPIFWLFHMEYSDDTKKWMQESNEPAHRSDAMGILGMLAGLLTGICIWAIFLGVIGVTIWWIWRRTK